MGSFLLQKFNRLDEGAEKNTQQLISFDIYRQYFFHSCILWSLSGFHNWFSLVATFLFRASPTPWTSPLISLRGLNYSRSFMTLAGDILAWKNLRQTLLLAFLNSECFLNCDLENCTGSLGKQQQQYWCKTVFCVWYMIIALWSSFKIKISQSSR